MDSPSGAGPKPGVPQDVHLGGLNTLGGSLLYAGRRVPIGSAGVLIGRGEACDVSVPHGRASREHARLYQDEDGSFLIEDLGSRNGTFLNGERLRNGARKLESGDMIVIGDETLRFVQGGGETRMASRQLPIVGIQTVVFDGHRMTLGRDPSNDVVLPDVNVSRFHAEVVANDDSLELIDLGSRNGTRLDGSPVDKATLVAGSQIGIGPYRLVFDGTSFVARDDHGALRLDAEGVMMEVKEKRILAPTSLSIEPGELVAIIGESGAGKSTLIKALAGVTTPTAGKVLINGEPVATRLTDLGYVPQDEIVHPLLTVTEALGYAARLRLPHDASKEEIEARIDNVLEELALEEQANTRIHSVSGGQRKRTGVATELLNRPSLLFLDEPTTGLDPGLEGRLMAMLRRLADNSRAVVVVTHATRNLALCDKVAVMARGGDLAFYGEPDKATRFFEVDSFDEIYTALEQKTGSEWRRQFEGGLAQDTATATNAIEEPARAPMPPRRRPQQRRLIPQTRVLTHRYMRLMVRDRRNLALLLGQVPVIALFIVAVFGNGLFRTPGNPSDGLQLLFLIVTTVIWLGSIDAAREIIKEKTVFQRESAVGTRLSSYLLSKAVVLFGLAAIQTLLLSAVVFAFQPLHQGIGVYAQLVAVLMVTSFVAVVLGLLISASVSTQDQATSFIPLILIPQLLFAGSLVPVHSMREPIRALSSLVFSRWSFSDVGSLADLNSRFAASAKFAPLNKFGHSFFELPFLRGVGILVAFLLVLFAGVTLLLRKQLRH